MLVTWVHLLSNKFHCCLGKISLVGPEEVFVAFDSSEDLY